MKSSISISILLSLMLANLFVRGQEKEDVILKAMKDELKRSMEIRETGYDKPFFISYGIADLKNFSSYAALGAIIQSGESLNRTKSLRVLVGNYEFNDESLDNDSFSESSAREIQLPEDDDYFGIRRALWTTTDVVYKGAAQKYRKHQSTLKEQQHTIADVPHRTFAKVPVVHFEEKPIAFTIDKKSLEDYTRKLSAVFCDYPELELSDVMLSVTGGENYFVSSEGSVVLKPYRFAVMQYRAQTKTEVGEPLVETIVHYGQAITDLPTLSDAVSEAKKMCDKLMNLRKSEGLEEEYSGPVLFLGSAVAEVFTSALFSYRETLMSSDGIISTTEVRPEATGLLDGRVGKIVIDNSINIRSIPMLRKFEQSNLIGSYDVDDEGVVPVKELQLIEKGVLKNMMNDRSIVKPSQTANGHASGPGVVEITSTKQTNEQLLKQSLIDAAKNDGLPYALIVRKNGDVGGSLAEVWKVELSTGKETLLHSAQPTPTILKDLRRIAGVSASLGAYTIQAGEGTLASMICPSALLLESVDVTPMKLPYLEHDITYVPSPLFK